MKKAKTDRYLYIQKVADTLGVTKNHIYALIKDGHLIAIRVGNRSLRVSEASLNRFIESRVVDSEEYFD